MIHIRNWLVVAIILTSCITDQKELRRAEVTEEMCKKWGLPPISFEISYPTDWNQEYNVNGGHYQIVRQFDGDTVVHEISFSYAGEINHDIFLANQEKIMSQISQKFTELGQEFKTVRICEDSILNSVSPFIHGQIISSGYFDETQNLWMKGKYDLYLIFEESKYTNPGFFITITSRDIKAIEPILESFKLK